MLADGEGCRGGRGCEEGRVQLGCLVGKRSGMHCCPWVREGGVLWSIVETIDG